LAVPALVALHSRPAAAAVFTVTSLADNTIPDAQTTFREAIIRANTSPGLDQIDFAPGILPGTIVLGGTALPTVTADLDILGPGAARLTIDGNHLSRVFAIDPGVAVLLQGVTATRGRATGLPGGGAILVSGGSLLVVDAVFSGNAATANGGAILNQGVGAVLTVSGTVFRANTAQNGGAIYNGGGTLQATEASFDANSTGGIAPFMGGGGAVLVDGGSVLLDRCTLSNNVAANGGAVAASFGFLTIRNSTISGNQAIGDGGGVASLGNLTVQSTTIAFNRADRNGGATGTGGGIDRTAGSVTINSTIVAHNLVGAAAGTPSDIAGTVQASSSYNLVGVDTGLSGIASGSNGNQIGTAGAPLDAGLLPLSDNGGYNRTHALRPDSPALDTSSSPACGVADQRLLDRPVDGDNDGTAVCDIGSYEAFFASSQPADFFTVPPCRLADTRAADGPAIDADTTRFFAAAGLCGIPADARAVALNVTGLGAPELGNLRLYPAGSSLPLVSTLNFRATTARGNHAVVSLGAAGLISARVSAMSAPAGSLHVVIDAFGYFR
jgi:hypothetical protein